jgi:hypothetical protein
VAVRRAFRRARTRPLKKGRKRTDVGIPSATALAPSTKYSLQENARCDILDSGRYSLVQFAS